MTKANVTKRGVFSEELRNKRASKWKVVITNRYIVRDNYAIIYNWICKEGVKTITESIMQQNGIEVANKNNPYIKATILATSLPIPKLATLSEMYLLFESLAAGRLQWIAEKKILDANGNYLLNLAKIGLRMMENLSGFEAIREPALFDEYKSLLK